MWIILFLTVAFLFYIDLVVLSKRSTALTVKSNIINSAIYLAFGIAFGVWIWYELGATSGNTYFTAFLIEKSMAFDNLLVISLIFSYFHIPPVMQKRLLTWGILGVIFLRGSVILAGWVILSHNSWILDVFSVLLILMGAKMLMHAEMPEVPFQDRFVYRYLVKFLPFHAEGSGDRFFARVLGDDQKLKIKATPLFVCLLSIECTDLLFSVDSLPALFSITLDPYIICASTVFATLGLRSVYFLIANFLGKLSYLKYSVAAILMVNGAKGLVEKFILLDKIPEYYMFLCTILFLLVGVIKSFKSEK